MADHQHLKDSPIRAVQVEALVAVKIAKHGASLFPTAATGALVGMDNGALLEVTNCFPFPVSDVAAGADTSNSQREQEASAAAAAATPRQRATTVYQNEFIKHLKEVNVDANSVGWYTSAAMGNYINLSFVENLFHYQKDNETAAGLVYDVSKSSQGALSLKAFRLTSTFMTAFKEGKFTTEILQKTKLSYRDILIEIPIIIHNSHLLTSFLHAVPAPPPEDANVDPPASLADLMRNPIPPPLFPSVELLDLSIDPYMEKTCDLLLESIEAHYTDLNNFQFYQRQLAREQAKIAQWQAKRKGENAARAAARQPALPEDEWQRLFKLPQEPSRLEGMLNARQVDQYSKQVDGFTATATAKMFAVRENILPSRS